MARGTKHSHWQIPLTVLASVTGSLIIVWAISTLAGFTMNPSLVAALSAAMGAAAIAATLGRRASNKRLEQNAKR